MQGGDSSLVPRLVSSSERSHSSPLLWVARASGGAVPEKNCEEALTSGLLVGPPVAAVGTLVTEVFVPLLEAQPAQNAGQQDKEFIKVLLPSIGL